MERAFALLLLIVRAAALFGAVLTLDVREAMPRRVRVVRMRKVAA